MAGAFQPRGGVRSDGAFREGGGDAEEEGIHKCAGMGGSAVTAEDPVRSAGVRNLSGVGRGDGEVLPRVHAAQEAAQECGEVSLVCNGLETPPWSTGTLWRGYWLAQVAVGVAPEVVRDPVRRGPHLGFI